MSKLKKFNDNDEYTRAKYSQKWNTPSVSYLHEEDELKYDDDPTLTGWQAKPFTIEVDIEDDPAPAFYTLYTNFFQDYTLDGNPLYVKASFDGGDTWFEGKGGDFMWDAFAQVAAHQQVMIISNGILEDVNLWDEASWGDHGDGAKCLKLSGNICSIGGGLSMKIDWDYVREVIHEHQRYSRLWGAFGSYKDLSENVGDCGDLYFPSPKFDYMYDDFFGHTNITVAPHLDLNTYDSVLSNMFTDCNNLVDMSRIHLGCPPNINPGYEKSHWVYIQTYLPSVTSWPTWNYPILNFTRGWNQGNFYINPVSGNTPIDLFVKAQGTNMSVLSGDTLVTDLSHLYIDYTHEYGGMIDGRESLVTSPKLYTDSMVDLTNDNAMTDLYLLGNSIPEINNVPDWTQLTVHYAPWANNVSEREEQYPDGTFTQYNDAILLFYFAGYDRTGDHVDYDSVTYYRTESCKDVNESPYWCWFRPSWNYMWDNAATLVKEALYNDVSYPVTYIEEDNTSGPWIIKWFSFTDSDNTVHKFGFTNNGEDDKLCAMIPVDEDGENIVPVFINGTPPSAIKNIKMIKYDNWD